MCSAGAVVADRQLRCAVVVAGGQVGGCLQLGQQHAAFGEIAHHLQAFAVLLGAEVQGVSGRIAEIDGDLDAGRRFAGPGSHRELAALQRCLGGLLAAGPYFVGDGDIDRAAAQLPAAGEVQTGGEAQGVLMQADVHLLGIAEVDAQRRVGGRGAG